MLFLQIHVQNNLSILGVIGMMTAFCVAKVNHLSDNIGRSRAEQKSCNVTLYASCGNDKNIIIV